jgi:hypothetical protein
MDFEPELALPNVSPEITRVMARTWPMHDGILTMQKAAARVCQQPSLCRVCRVACSHDETQERVPSPPPTYSCGGCDVYGGVDLLIFNAFAIEFSLHVSITEDTTSM